MVKYISISARYVWNTHAWEKLFNSLLTHTLIYKYIYTHTFTYKHKHFVFKIQVNYSVVEGCSKNSKNNFDATYSCEPVNLPFN